MKQAEEKYESLPKRLREYEASMKAYNDIQNSIDTAKKDTRIDEKIQTVKRSFSLGLSLEQIAQIAGLSIGEVQRIQEEIKN